MCFQWGGCGWCWCGQRLCDVTSWGRTWADQASWAYVLPAADSATLPRQYSSSNFSSVNIHYVASFQQNERRKKNPIDLTNVDHFSCVPINIGWQISLRQMELADLVEFGLKILGISIWYRDVTSHNLCPLPCRTYSTPFPCPAVLLPADEGNYFTQQERERIRAH